METYIDFECENILNEHRVFTYGELFEELGIREYISKYQVINEYNRFDMRNIRINSEFLKYVDKCILHDLYYVSNRYNVDLGRDELDCVFELSKLVFEPYIDDRVPYGIIRVLNKHDDEYIAYKDKNFRVGIV